MNPDKIDQLYELSCDNRRLKLQMDRMESKLTQIHWLVFFTWLLLLVLIPVTAIALL